MRRFWCSGDSTSKRVLDVLESFYLRLWKIVMMMMMMTIIVGGFIAYAPVAATLQDRPRLF